jgi:hypothetical protein
VRSTIESNMFRRFYTTFHCYTHLIFFYLEASVNLKNNNSSKCYSEVLINSQSKKEFLKINFQTANGYDVNFNLLSP